MSPQHPKPRNLRRENRKRSLERSDQLAGATVSRQERGRVLALERILRLILHRDGEEPSMDVQKRCKWQC
jgi:hypothetical protein